MKKILLFTLVTLSFVLRAQDDSQEPKQFTPQKTVIAFDLHEVVLDYSHLNAASGAYDFVKSNPWYFIKMLFSPDCWRKTYTIVKSTPKIGEALFDKLTVHYPELAQSKTEFLRMLNPHVINPEMAQLIKELKQNNYRLAVCSNIGQQALEESRKMGNDEFFNQFEVLGISRPSTDPEKHYLLKPDPRFFEEFKMQCRQELGIKDLDFKFVDDKKKNVTAAELAGITAFLFKKAQKFRAELIEHGIEIS
jgi:FMN phosphatase YigB (HAD superfamily)